MSVDDFMGSPRYDQIVAMVDGDGGAAPGPTTAATGPDAERVARLRQAGTAEEVAAVLDVVPV